MLRCVMRTARGFACGTAGEHECGVLLDINVGGGRPHRCAIFLQDVVEDRGQCRRKGCRKSALNALLRQHDPAIHKGLHGVDRVGRQRRGKWHRHRTEFQRCQIGCDPKQRIVAQNADAIAGANAAGQHFCNQSGAGLAQISISVLEIVGDDGDIVIASVFKKIVGGIHAPPPGRIGTINGRHLTVRRSRRLAGLVADISGDFGDRIEVVRHDVFVGDFDSELLFNEHD